MPIVIPDGTPYGTEEYKFAKSVTRAKVIIEIYDDSPNSDRQVLRVRHEIDGEEHGCEYALRPFTQQTIGKLLDLSLKKLMETKGNEDATKPSEE